MEKICPKCEIEYGSFFANYCSECGSELVPLPHCNWCKNEISPHVKYCDGCGRERAEVINTFPPLNIFQKIISYIKKRGMK